MASIQVTSKNSSSVTFKFTLTYAFNSSNYIEVGITDKEFTNESSELPGSRLMPVTTAPSSGTSTKVYVTITGLEPETTYYLYGYALTPNGYYYCVGDEVEVTTDSVSYPAPIIESFDVWQEEPYNNLAIAWDFYAHELYNGITTYKVQARKKGASGWTTKTSGTITLPTTNGEGFTVPSAGEWEFRFILDNDGVTTTSDVVTLTVISYSAPIINSFSVEQVSPYINREVTWTYSASDVYGGITTYQLQARKVGTSAWAIKTDGTTEEDGSIAIENVTVPDVGEWEFRLVLDTEGAEATSDVVALTVVDGLTITKLTVLARTDSAFWFKYQGAEEAEGFNIIITRNYDGYEYVGNASKYAKTILWKTTDENWEFGVQCTLEIQAYNSWGNGDWALYTPLTTAPSKPVISLSQDNGYISVNFGVENITNITHMKFLLYRVGKTTDEDESLIETGDYTVPNDTYSPSGVHQFQTQCEDAIIYRVEVRSILNLGTIGAQNDFDGKEEIDADIAQYIIISLSGKPELWTWTQIYELSTGGTGTICAEAYVPIDEDGVHPVTAEEWNKFVAKVNEVRAWANSKVTVTGSDLSTVSPGGDFKSAYNLAVEAIKNIEGVAEGLTEIVTGTELNSYLFTSIVSALNDAINNL